MRDRLLHILADLIGRRPRAIIAVGAAGAIVCALYAATSLRLNANLDDLIAPDRPFMADYRRFINEFGDLEQIIIAVDASKDRAAAERVVDALLPRLRAIPDVEAVHGSIEPQERSRIATRAMSDADLLDLALAADALPALRTGDAATIVKQADATLANLIAEGAAMPEDDQRRGLASAAFLLDAIASSGDQESHTSNPKSPSRTYLASDTGRLLFIHILPRKDYATLEVIAEPIARIREAIDQIRRERPGVEIGLTGKPVMQHDEMATSNRDMMRASAIALALCSMLFMAMIGGVRRPLLAMLAFAMAAAWTYGFATLAVGQLNLLSLVFMLVLVGVGLDYGVHIINRYQEFLASGANARDAIRRAVVVAVRGNITGALTSSIVFFMAMFTTFQGLRELGLIAGGGLILCLVAMSVVLPAMLVIADQPNRPARIAKERGADETGADAWFIRHAGFVLALAASVTIGSAVIAMRGGGKGVRFDDNLLNLQAKGLESIEWEHRILNDSAAASWFGAVIAPDQETVQAIIARAKAMPAIGAIRSVFDVIQPDSPQRDEWREALHAHSPGLARGNPPPDLAASIKQATARLQLIAQAASARAPEEAKPLLDLFDALNAMDLNSAATRQAIDASLAAMTKSLDAMLEGDRLPLREALPDAVRDQFVSAAGSLLVMLHPKHDVWDPAAMAMFINDLRAVDPHVTGAPITHFESLGEMRRAFITMSLLAFAAIVILLAIDFRSVRDVLLAITPLIVGAVWTLGAMRLLGVSFNLANFFAAPMLIGLSVDSAVHMLHRYHEGGDRSGGLDRLRFGRTRRAVILTSFTTIIGFGALIIAQHRGLQSLGVVMALGSTACMIASIVVLPALLAWRERASKAQA